MCNVKIDAVTILHNKISNIEGTNKSPSKDEEIRAQHPASWEPSLAPPNPPKSIGPPAPPRAAQFKRKKSPFMEKPKVLYIGDSIAHNANFARLEKVTKSRIRTVKAYSSVEDIKARFAHKNFSDITPSVLIDTFEEDAYTHLVLAAPSVDISNMNTARLTAKDNIEVFKQNVISSGHNMISVAENACKNHPELVKVVIMEHAPRYETHDVDPTGLKFLPMLPWTICGTTLT